MMSQNVVTTFLDRMSQNVVAEKKIFLTTLFGHPLPNFTTNGPANRLHLPSAQARFQRIVPGLDI